MLNKSVLLTIALFSLFGCSVMNPTPPGNCACADLGKSQHPKLLPGVYYVNPTDFCLYHLSAGGSAPRKVSGAEWKGTTSVTSLGRWLYIVQDGKLHRVNPETGCWYPRSFEGPDCDWYTKLASPVWAENGKLYGFSSDVPGNRQILQVDFDKRTTKVVAGDSQFPSDSMCPRLSTEVH